MSKKERQTNYQTFYKDAIQKKEGYVTKDGMWAAIPLMDSKKFAIINNGDWVHTCRNYEYARAYIIKENRKSK